MDDRRGLSVVVAGLGALLTACAPLGRISTSPAAIAAADSAVKAAIRTEASIDARRFPAAAVGVTPFRVTAADTSLHVLGFGLADLLITDLARSSQLQVVDRLRVDALLRELDLVATGRVDSATAPRVGRLIGARRLVLGSLTADPNRQVRLDGRVGDVATGRITATTPSRASLDAVLDAEKNLAFRLFEALGIRLTPAEQAQVEQRPTRSLAALLAYSRGVRSEAQGDLRGARLEYQRAATADPNFPNARDRLDQVGRWLAEVPSQPSIGRFNPAGVLAAEGVQRATLPTSLGVIDPAFHQRLLATLIIVLQLP